MNLQGMMCNMSVIDDTQEREIMRQFVRGAISQEKAVKDIGSEQQFNKLFDDLKSTAQPVDKSKTNPTGGNSLLDSLDDIFGD